MSNFEKDMAEFGEIARGYPGELAKAKKKGEKVICWYGSYIPEELIYASGAKPYILCDGGGDPVPAEAALPYVLFCINIQARHQIGLYEMGMHPVLDQADRIYTDTKECDGVRVADYFEFKGLPVTKVGVPADWEKDIAFDYYHRQLKDMKLELEGITGQEITDERLADSIQKYNRIRELLTRIGEMRKGHPPVIGGQDYIKLHHYTFKSDPDVAINYLEKILEDLKEEESPFPDDTRRIVLAGRGCVLGDYTILNLLEESGGVSVAELFDEGIRHLETIRQNGDPMNNLAEGYYRTRLRSCLFNPSFDDRWKFLNKQLDDYQADGLLYYQLAFDVIYDYEWPIFAKRANERNMPFQEVESGYDISREATGPLRTRVESFIEVCRSGV